MSENESSPEGQLPSQENKGRFHVNKALTETAKFLFPYAITARAIVRKDLGEQEGVGRAKVIRRVFSAVGGFFDVGRWAAVASLAKSATDADSTKTIIGFSAAAAGLTVIPYIPNIPKTVEVLRRNMKRGR